MNATGLDPTWTVWLSAAALAVLTVTGLLLARHAIGVRWGALAARTNNDVDDLIVGLARGTRTWFMVVLGVAAASQLLAWSGRVNGMVRASVILALVVQGALWGNRVIKHVVQRHAAQHADDAVSATTTGALIFVARLVLWSGLVLLGLDNLGVDITALVAGLGVGGIAVALAVQSILGDLFASLSIVLDKPFVVGDFIIVDDLLGTVEYVGLKTTRVRSLHGEQIIFSNTDLLQSRIRNYKRMEERRVVFALGVTYATSRENLALIPQLIRGIIDRVADVRFDRAHLKGFGAYSLDFEVVYYVRDGDYNRYMDIQQVINLAIVDAFAAAGIEFAFPTQTLHVQAAAAGAAARRLNV